VHRDGTAEDGLLTELEYRARRDIEYGLLAGLIAQNRQLLDDLEAGIILDKEASSLAHRVPDRARRPRSRGKHAGRRHKRPK